MTLAEIHNRAIQEALERNGGCQRRAARELAVHPRTISRWLRAVGGQLAPGGTESNNAVRIRYGSSDGADTENTEGQMDGPVGVTTGW